MSNGYTFRAQILGTPAPQGSKRHVGGGTLVESSAALEPWRQAVALQTRAIMHRQLFKGYGVHVPLSIDLVFYLRRPPSLPRKIGRHARKPDLDKLVRGTLDALKESGLIVDDGQIDHIIARKQYAQGNYPLGCHYEISCADGASS